MRRISGEIRRLCVQWSRLGPYHLARLEAAHHHGAAMGRTLVALETAAGDATYAWKQESAARSFAREVVFPGHVYEDLPAAQIHAGVTSTLDRINPDAVAITSYSTPDARACLLWCRRRDRPAILMTETKEDDAPRIFWREAIKRSLVRLYDAALVGGTRHRSYLEKLGMPADAIFYGFDAVDNLYFERGAHDARTHPAGKAHLPGLDDPHPFFLASNRFVARKNLATLVHAYATYRRSTPDPWRLLLLGDGPERATLEALVHSETVSGITFCGFRQIEDLPAYYGLAGAFIHPPLVEPWGLVVNEAMAAGLPVLVSSRAGCAEDLVVQGKNGFLFDPADTTELARLMGVLSSPETNRAAMGRASMERIAGWSPEHFAHGLWDATQFASNRHRAPGPAGDAYLWLIQRLSRRVHSFHSVRD